MDFRVFISLAVLIVFCNAVTVKQKYGGVEQDPITITCRYDFKGHHKIREETSDNREDLDEMADEIAVTGRKLSMFFNGFKTLISDATMNGWYDSSETDICSVSYPILNTAYPDMNKLLTTKRLPFAAKISQLFVSRLNATREGKRHVILRVDSQLKAVGIGFGAAVAASFCRQIFKLTSHKVGFLLGLDPFTSLFESFIGSGDAAYVQIIHTTKIVGFLKKTGDASIIVHTDCSFINLDANHLLVVSVFERTATQEEFLIATKATNNVRGEIHEWNEVIDTITLKDYECEVGIYNKDRHKGEFHITIPIEGNCRILPKWLTSS